MKRNKYTIFSLIIIAMVSITTIFSANQNSNLDIGTYIYENETILYDSSIIINENKTFSYTISLLSDYMPTGIYKIEGNKLHLITSEGDAILAINSKDKTITMLEDPFSSESIGRIFTLK